MRCPIYFAIALVLGTLPTASIAQKPKNPGKSAYARTTGKGTPAYLAHHKDNSDLILRQNTHNATTELNRLEQQSLHSSVPSGVPKARVHLAAVPKVAAAKGDRSAPINFSGHNPDRSLTTTKSGKSTGATPAKPH